MIHVTCDYCERPARLTTGREVYPHRPDLFSKRFYKCTPCGAWVGCHDGTHTPLGRLANAELRKAKMEAHDAFDPFWRSEAKRQGLSRGKARRRAYKWLAEQLGIEPQLCHIGMFDVETCQRVVEVCRSRNHD